MFETATVGEQPEASHGEPTATATSAAKQIARPLPSVAADQETAGPSPPVQPSALAWESAWARP